MLRPHRRIGTGRLQPALGGLHLGDGLLQEVGDLLEALRLVSHPIVELGEKLVHLLAQPLLHQPDDDRSFAQLLRSGGLAIALDVERRGDDLAFLFRQCADLVLLLAPAAPAARLRLCLLEVLLQWTHAHEVQIAHRLLRAADRVVIADARVIRHRVARLHAQLLEIERVPRRHVGHPRAAGEQRDRLLRAAVHAVDEVQRLDAVVVLGFRLEEHFLDRGRGGVAAGFRERHGRRLIGEDIDGIFRRPADTGSAGRVELDAVEAIVVRQEGPPQRPVALHRHRHLGLVVHHNRAA